MNPLRSIWIRLRSLAQPRAAKREIDEELRFHLEQRIAENIAAGMSQEQAAQDARKRFGNLQSVREECHETRGADLSAAIWQDFRFGLRMLRKNPGFTVVAILTLALGISANAVIFSLINGVLLRPLPYRNPDRLVTVCESSLKRGFQQIVVAPANLRDWNAQNSVFEELGGQINNSMNLTGNGNSEHLHTAWTTPNYFFVFGVPPLLGRTFVADDAPPNHRVAVLSYGLWQRSFGGDPGIIGKTITLSEMDYTVIGVMPREFKIYRPAAVFGLPTGDVQPQVWLPYPGPMDYRKSKYFLAFARLKPGISAVQAQDELNVIAARIKRDYPAQSDLGASVQPLGEQIVGSSRLALRLLSGAVGFVLLIACVNVSNLSLARAATRAREFAIRSALGATRSRMIRQLLIESLVLAILGGGLAVLLAEWGVAGLKALQLANLPRLDEIRLDHTVLAFTLAVSVATGLLFGIAPALLSSKPDLNGAMKDSHSGESRHHKRVRSLLVTAEVAMAMVLLTGAGLMLNSFTRLLQVDPGFRPQQLIIFDVSPAGRIYNDEARRMSLVKQLRDRVQSYPGVEAAATIWGLPFGTMLTSLVLTAIEGRPIDDTSGKVSVAWRVASPNYFQMMGIPLKAGRYFSEESDTRDSLPVVIINEACARKYFLGENPIGKRIQLTTIGTNWNQIVGVVKDVKLTGLEAAAVPEVYQSDSQAGEWGFSLVVRSALPLRDIEQFVRTQAMVLDKDLPLFNVRTMGQGIGASVKPRQFIVMLISLFAALALALTVIGIVGVVSYTVNQRTREIGIRMALGASRRSVIALMLLEGMRPALIGIGIGLAGCFGLTRLIAAQLYEISPADPLTFVSTVAFLVIVIIAACYWPARQAARTQPIIALRHE